MDGMMLWLDGMSAHSSDNMHNACQLCQDLVTGGFVLLPNKRWYDMCRNAYACENVHACIS